MFEAAFWIALLALALFFYGPWQVFCEDWGRQRIFAIRDSIFDIALNGGIGFRDRNYVAIRRSLNYTIRFMHEMTWPRIVSIALNLRSLGVVLGKSELEQSISSIGDDELRANLERKMEEVGRVMLIVLIGRSPLLLAILILLAPIVIIVAVLNDIRGIFRQSFRHLQRDVEMVEGALGAL